jgi:hypothetical protein
MMFDTAETTSKPPNSGSGSHAGGDRSRGIPEDARKRFELLQECRELVVTRLCKVIAEALSKMSSELTELALKSGQREQQQALMDAVSLVRQNRTEIETRFRKSFVDCFEKRLFNTQPKPSEEFEGELSLIDESVITDKLTVDRLVHRSRGKLDPDEVLGIRARLAALLERDWFEETSHPAAPEVVFEALKSALSELAPDMSVQSALLNAFEPHVSSQLNGVYNTVNDRLKANMVLPRIRPQVAVNRSAPKAPQAQPPAVDPGAAFAPHAHGGAMQAGGFAPGPGMAAAGIAPAPMMSAGAQQFIADTFQQLEQGVPSARLSAAKLLTDPATFGVADLPLPSAQAPLIDAISTLQVQPASADAASGLTSELMARAKQDGSALDQLTVEIVSMVFDYIYSDKRLPDSIKQQLLRLQVVAVKAALIDRSFFARRQHPMRRLIDRISELATDPDSDVAADSALVQGLSGLVQWILDEFDRDLATFDEAIARLELLADAENDRRAKRLAQLTEQAERDEALGAAREMSAKLLAERMDAATPVFMRAFVDRWWVEVCALAQLNDSQDGLRTAEALQLVEALIWSVGPKLPEEVTRLASILPKLITGVMRGLKSIDMPDGDREAFFNDLLKSHTQSIESAKNKELQRIVAERVESRLRMRSDGSIHFTPARNTATHVSGSSPTPSPATAPSGLPDLQRGDRIEVDQGDEAVQYKLAWISPSQRLYVLSRFPDEARSLPVAELIDLFRSGKARLIEKRSNVDSAIHSIEPKAESVVPEAASIH